MVTGQLFNAEDAPRGTCQRLMAVYYMLLNPCMYAGTIESSILRPVEKPVHLDVDINLQGNRPCLLPPACDHVPVHELVSMHPQVF